ncbi:ABC transporter substrate-binding protein [Actinotalea sp. AC32]|nr:ABC transporter substrate-binding protein [Actinotalea sp. AC32]
MNARRVARTLSLPVAALLLAACSQSDPLEEPAAGTSEPGGEESAAIVIGSQDYYSNEIIAELYAQALEAEGYTVERDLRIGQREVYLPEIESGAIDLFPEYTGNLLQYWEPETEARTSDDVYAALREAVPDGLQVLDQSSATDQDSYNVTREFSEANGVTSLADLASVGEPLTLGGNSELATRPYGPEGLQSVYGVEVGFTPIEDSGGPLTVKALQDGTVQLVNIYSADPSIAANDLVTLEDPEGLFLASNVVPVAADDLDEGAVEVVNAVSAALTPEELVALNARSVDEQAPAATIAGDWLAENGLA